MKKLYRTEVRSMQHTKSNANRFLGTDNVNLVANLFSILRSNKRHRLVIALLLSCLVPTHANCAEQNWRKQIQEIGQSVAQPDLIEKQLILTKALEESEKTKSSNFPEYAEIVLSLADTYANEGDFKKAERCLAEAAYITPYPPDVNYPINYPSGTESPYMVAMVNRQLGWLETRTKQYDFAMKSYVLTQRIWRELWGAKDPKLAAVKNDMAALEYQRGEYNKAAELFHEAIQLTEPIAKQSAITTKPWKSKPGNNYQNTMKDYEKDAMLERKRTFSGYSKTLDKLGRTSEAESASREATEVDRFLGPIKMLKSESALCPPNV